MRIQCPKCKKAVPPNQVNVATDLAFCPDCIYGFRISESIDMDSVNEEILHQPPAGAWYRQEMNRTVVGATSRSPVAFFLVPFMCVWSGGSLGGIYGSQIVNGQFNLIMSLFGIPFLLGSIVFWSIALMSICGKVEVSIGSVSYVFVGIGKLGWTREFDWSDVQVIREEVNRVNYPGGHPGVIVMEGKNRIKFGSGLSDKRKFYMLGVLKFLKTKSGPSGVI